ncbi:MAG: BCAM0308 family protein [Prochlorococcaceae cyanobacterium]
MAQLNAGRSATHQPRHDGVNTEAHRGDPYRPEAKIAEPAVCPDCQASYRKGRWCWEPPAAEATPHRCPACARIHDGLPAGLLHLSGAFVASHCEEIMRLVNNTEARIRSERPLERLMAVDTADAGLGTEDDRGVELSFTGTHITRAVGKAIEAAYGGRLEAPFGEQGGVLRCHWQRD